jgi:hypothetical protein
MTPLDIIPPIWGAVTIIVVAACQVASSADRDSQRDVDDTAPHEPK